MELNRNKHKIIIIVGPTASGKSDLGIKIAKKYNGEIISADSRQVYKGMDIGTGKVKKDKYRIYDLRFKNKKNNSKILNHKSYISNGVIHHLVDVTSPKKQFTADDFKRLGGKAITDITRRHKLPIIVGGTGFYIDILLGRMATAEVPPNPKFRKKLEKLEIDKLFAKLKKLDPEGAKIIDRHNKRRLVRALEINLAKKERVNRNVNTESDSNFYHDRDKNYYIKYKTLWLGINPGKDGLAQNIKNRLDQRLKPFLAKASTVGQTKSSFDSIKSTNKQGIIEEVQKLRKQGLSWTRLDAFGLEYRWISRWLIQNTKTKNQNDNVKMKSFKNSDEYKNLLRAIVRYSKRQMTWFKRNKEIHWLAPSKVEKIKNHKTAEHLVQQFLN